MVGTLTLCPLYDAVQPRVLSPERCGDDDQDHAEYREATHRGRQQHDEPERSASFVAVRAGFGKDERAMLLRIGGEAEPQRREQNENSRHEIAP
jgi:hypothetical protein